MIENLDMGGLRAFVAIAETMSFSRAGTVVGRSQPTISLRLRNLERALGVSLLTRRQGRVVELTADGRALLAYARQIIAINDSALRELGNRAGTRLRLGVPADVLDPELGGQLARVEERFPGLRVELCTDVSATLRERCLAGDLDVVLVKDIDGDPSGGRVVRRVPLAWAGTARTNNSPGTARTNNSPGTARTNNSPGTARTNNSPGTAEWQPAGEVHLAAFPEGCAYRHWMIAALTALRRDHRVVFTSPDLGAVCDMVASGLAVSVLPVDVIARRPGLRAITAGLPPPSSACLVMQIAPSSPPAARRVADWLVRGLGNDDRAAGAA